MNYNTIQIGITSYCNRTCPSCIAGVGKIKKPKHMLLEELKKIAKYTYGIKEVYVVGGEPTLHPNFKEWSYEFKKLFGCSRLIIWTNGYGFKKFPEVFINYDWVIVTEYSDKIYQGCPSNQDDIRYIQEYYKYRPPLITTGANPHIPLDNVGKGKPCGRSMMPYFLNDHVFPCSSGMYLKEAVSIPITSKWKEEVPKVSLPCKYCVFSI